MREGRKPAQCVDSFGRPQDTSSSTTKQEVQIIQQNGVSQSPLPPKLHIHTRSAPNLYVIPANHKPRAKVVQETHNRLNVAYLKPKTSLKTLQFHDTTGNRVKSPRREAAIALLQVMNYYQDDATGRVGRQLDNGRFNDMSLKKLAEHANIAIRRAKRAMKDIVRAGYIKVIKQFKQIIETGEIIGLPSIRSFLPKFYLDLEVKGETWTKWFSQRGWAKERSDKKLTKLNRKTSRAMFGLIKETLGSMGKKGKSLTNKMMGIAKGVPPVECEKTKADRVSHEQKLTKKALELFNLDPSRSPSEYYKALKEAHPLK